MNLKKILLLLLAGSLLFVKCDSPNGPINNEDIVLQIDIPWPSLGNTPWPMHHHDPQSTGRSKYSGPQNGILAKKVYVGMSYSGISIGYHKSVLLSTFSPYKLYSLDYDGNVKWEYPLLFCNTTPLINSDSIIYVAGEIYFTAFNHNGDILWQRKMNNQDRMVSVGINIDLNGNLYYVDYNHTLTVLDKNGNFKWSLKDNRFLSLTYAAPTFSPDGKTLYIQGINVSLLAVDINNQTIKWTFGYHQLLSSPVVDNNGNIYIIPNAEEFDNNRKIYSLNSFGEINWEFSFIGDNHWDNTAPTIDYNGNIYFGVDTLYSLTNSGKFRWEIPLNGTQIVSPLICDKDNVIYIATDNIGTGENNVIAIKDNGEIKWEIVDSIERALGASPALSEDRTLFYPTWDNEKGNYLVIK